MLIAIIQGILIGLGLGIMIGPVFLALMSVTITEGKRKAYRFIAGNSISDIVIAILTYQGMVLWRGTHSAEGRIIGIIGACIFFIYGLYLLNKKETKADVTIEKDPKKWKISNIGAALRGFAMNTFNPSIFVFRVTVIGHFIRKHHQPAPHMVWVFMGCILLTFIITDVIKVNSADWILRKLTIKNLDTLHNIAGAALVIASFAILARTFLSIF